ncbi:MAG: inositol monophosphatase family protein [Gemmataceae bacterium]
MSSPHLSRHKAAIGFAQKAAASALALFDTDLQIEIKEDLSPVTKADKEAEAILRESLTTAFPGDSFLGEEYGDQKGSTGYRWIIDPIDGTKNYIRGIPIWGTLLGLEFENDLVGGIVVAPALGQTWHGLRGEGAYRNDKRIRVTDTPKLAQSHLFYSSLTWIQKSGKTKGFLDLIDNSERQRGFGDFYGFMLVAQGAGEAMIDHGLHPWDVAALKPIVDEAGGLLTNWDGGFSIHRSDVVGSNRLIHSRLLESLGT